VQTHGQPLTLVTAKRQSLYLIVWHTTDSIKYTSWYTHTAYRHSLWDASISQKWTVWCMNQQCQSTHLII